MRLPIEVFRPIPSLNQRATSITSLPVCIPFQISRHHLFRSIRWSKVGIDRLEYVGSAEVRNRWDRVQLQVRIVARVGIGMRDRWIDPDKTVLMQGLFLRDGPFHLRLRVGTQIHLSCQIAMAPLRCDDVQILFEPSMVDELHVAFVVLLFRQS